MFPVGLRTVPEKGYSSINLVHNELMMFVVRYREQYARTDSDFTSIARLLL